MSYFVDSRTHFLSHIDVSKNWAHLRNYGVLESQFFPNFNTDAIPVYFNLPRNCKVNVKVAKEIQIISTGYKRQRIAVDAMHLPKNENFHKAVTVAELIEYWLNIMWNKRPGSPRNPQVKNKIAQKRGYLVVIPNGTTSQLQPLHVSVNHLRITSERNMKPGC